MKVHWRRQLGGIGAHSPFDLQQQFFSSLRKMEATHTNVMTTHSLWFAIQQKRSVALRKALEYFSTVPLSPTRLRCSPDPLVG